MKTITTSAAPVVRTTQEFGFDNVLAVTFSGRTTPNGTRQTFAMNLPKRGFNRKDGSVSLTNRSGNWGHDPHVGGPGYVRLWGFKSETVTFKDGSLALWDHKS